MYWVVQENFRDERMYDEFLRAIRELNLDHSVVKVVPFSHETIPDVNPTGSVICWGSVSMDDVAKKKGWKPGTFLNENFDQRIWTAKYSTCETCMGRGIEYSGVCHCGEYVDRHSGYDNHSAVEMTRTCEDCAGKSESYILNSDAEFYQFGQIPEFKGMRFIRPVSDMKIFSGMLVHSEEVENWKESIQRCSDSFTTLRADTMIGISTMKDIMMEWRFFVVNGRVITGSRYYQWGLSDQRRVESDSESWKFAQKMVDHWQPAKAFVIDIAQLARTEEYKVIEINNMNSAGFYCVDVRAVVEAIECMIPS